MSGNAKCPRCNWRGDSSDAARAAVDGCQYACPRCGDRGGIELLGDEPACGQDSCDEDATMRMFWPGAKALPVCALCAVKARSIAHAMGFHLEVEARHAS